MKLITSILIVIIFFTFSCSTEEATFEYDLIGSWIPIQYSDSLITVTKSEQLENNKQGFIFREGGELVKRETIQVVDDTPVAYWDFDGTWGQSDSILSLKIEHWEGTETSVWKLRGLTGDTLKLVKIKDK